MLKVLQQHPDVGLAGPKVIGGDGALQRTCRQLPTVWNTFCRSILLDSLLPKWPVFSGREMRYWKHDTQSEVEVLSGCFWVARRQAVQQVGNLDERFFFYAEDVDWCKRFREAGWKVLFIPSAVTTHFGGGSSKNAPLRYSIEIMRANLTYWQKHHGAVGRATFYVLAVVYYAVRLLLLQLKPGNPNGEKANEVRRHFTCLRWLCTGKGV
jgi:hypothetical protein